MKAKAQRVLVVGGGVGGLTLAAGLATAGAAVQVQVFEQSTRLRAQGAGLTLWPRAVAALGGLGLGDPLLRVAEPFDRVQILSSRGRVLATVGLADLARRWGAPCVNLDRGALLGVLADAAGAVLVTGKRCVAVREPPPAGYVEVGFDDGTTAQGDLLVGADGAGSTVRRLLDAGSHPAVRGWAGWQGIAPQRPAGVPAGCSLGVLGRPTFVGLYPLPAGRLGWFVDRWGRAAPDPAQASPAALLAWLEGWPPVVREAIAATPPVAFRYDEVGDHLPTWPWRWRTQRVTLLGDAAHAMLPTLGRGACEAIEDAAVLVAALGAAREPTAALRSYEACRMPRAARYVRLARTTTRARRLAARLEPLIRLLPAGLTQRQSARYLRIASE